jgi:alpha-beta hydrolase superfamily lysophospholipase
VKRTAATLVLALALLAGWLLSPLPTEGLDAHPGPRAGFDEGLRLVEAMRREDGPAIAPECRTELLSHGARSGRVIVLLHGLTNCPAQFDSLGRLLFAGGANVLIPRLPHHGLADHMTGELARMDARELTATVERALDAAGGLGDTVIVAGLSVGGVMAAWAAQERPDVDRAVLIAPMLGVAAAPARLTPAVTRLMNILPNRFVWWDDKVRERLPGPRHVYPRFATRAVGATLLLSARVQADARHSAPACRSIAVVQVGGDGAVDNAVTADLVGRWSRLAGIEIAVHEFPSALHLSHDVVDPEQVGGRPPVTYPVLLRAIAPGR